MWPCGPNWGPLTGTIGPYLMGPLGLLGNMTIFPGPTFNTICSPTDYNVASLGRTFLPGIARRTSLPPSLGRYRHCWRNLRRNPFRCRLTRVPSPASPLAYARLFPPRFLFSTGIDHCRPSRSRLHLRWNHPPPRTMPLRSSLTSLRTLVSTFPLRAFFTCPAGPSRSRISLSLRPRQMWISPPRLRRVGPRINDDFPPSL